MSEEQEDDSYVMMVVVDDVRTITKVLNPILLKNNQTCTFEITVEGLKVYTESSSTLQASGWLRKELFADFEYYPAADPSQDGQNGSAVSTQDGSTYFGCNLQTLMQSLTTMNDSAMGESTGCKMCYAGPGCPLVLMLNEEGVMTDCGLCTISTDVPLDFEFVAFNIQSKIIVRSDVLKDVLGEFESMRSGTKKEIITLEASPGKLVMRTDLPSSAFEVEIPDSSEAVTKLHVEETHENKYLLSLLMSVTKSMGVSRDTCIRMNSKGLLSVQCIVLLPNQLQAVVEFLMVPCINEEDELALQD